MPVRLEHRLFGAPQPYERAVTIALGFGRNRQPAGFLDGEEALGQGLRARPRPDALEIDADAYALAQGQQQAVAAVAPVAVMAGMRRIQPRTATDVAAQRQRTPCDTELRRPPLPCPR